MNDERIVSLLLARDESALHAVQEKYGRYCYTIAERILGSHEDAEECVNDTYRRTWETIPPKRPSVLSTYLGMLTRSISLDRVRSHMAERRGGGQVILALDELAECVADAPANGEHDELLQQLLDEFLSSLPRKSVMVFVRRYWYMDRVADIAAAYDMNENSVNALLFRIRKKLKKYLHDAGIDV